MTESEQDTNIEELQNELDTIKELWQKDRTLEMPEHIERARTLAADLSEPHDKNRGKVWYQEDCVHGSFVAKDLYPREELKQRIQQEAAEQHHELLEFFELEPEGLEIRWMTFEDGVVIYKLTHDDIPVIHHEHLPQVGPNTKEVEEVFEDV
jgi:hypothetical protein